MPTYRVTMLTQDGTVQVEVTAIAPTNGTACALALEVANEDPAVQGHGPIGLVSCEKQDLKPWLTDLRARTGG